LLSKAEELPGVADDETRFGLGRAFVRRIGGRNVWILYRLDDDHVFAVTTRRYPTGTDRLRTQSNLSVEKRCPGGSERRALSPGELPGTCPA
jgi:hypothetical protein